MDGAALQQLQPANLPSSSRSPSPSPLIQPGKLYGFEINDADLKRNDSKFPAPLRLTTLDGSKGVQFISSQRDRQNVRYYDQSDNIFFSLIYLRWNPTLIGDGGFENTDFPVPHDVRELAQEQRWITEEYQHLWHNDSGGSAAVLEDGKAGFILQTPNDDGPFCSLSLSEYRSSDSDLPSCGGFYIAHEDFDLDSLLSSQSLAEHNDPLCKLHDMFMALPIKILQKHVATTRKDLMKLADYLRKTEERIAKGKVSRNIEDDNKLLNSMNLEHMKIHRRWNFELELSASILEYFDMVAARDDGRYRHDVNAFTKPMREQVKRQIRYSKALEYDLEVIPKRVRNQAKAIFNIIVQRDSQSNLMIADSTAKIAEASRLDSSSMKTIAVLTLLFLPGTYIASFFSMSMFNWQEDGGHVVSSKNLWLYFAIAVPLTLIILAAWLVFYYCYQKPRSRRLLMKPLDLEAAGRWPSTGVSSASNGSRQS